MRYLAILLIIVSATFAQDILTLKTGKQHRVRFVEIRDSTAFMVPEVASVWGPAAQGIHLKLIHSIVLNNGVVAWDSGDEPPERIADESVERRTQAMEVSLAHLGLATASDVVIRLAEDRKPVRGKIIFTDERTIHLEIDPNDVLILPKKKIVSIHQDGKNVTRQYLSNTEIQSRRRTILVPVVVVIGLGFLAYYLFWLSLINSPAMAI
ncbi:MAG: hypothetical protein KAU50_00335 [Candidatus Marinimicrobia bacterium]|nr:hypothetical protein [Candidatus Neomarinimicrobiota bacterium]